MKCTVVIIDTASIQDYVFSSNKLKENIGASYLVENIYNDELKTAIEKVFPHESVDINEWKTDIEKGTQDDNFDAGTKKFRIGYIGGGNALIFFNEKDKHIEFIKEFTKILLLTAPGIRTAFGIEENFDFENYRRDYKKSTEKLYESLKKNKNTYFPVITIPKHGITTDCPLSHESAEYFFKDKEKRFISRVSDSKLGKSDKSKETIEEKYKYVLRGKLITNETEDLGQRKGESNYVAVVHIDGNGMGNRFKSRNTLKDMRELSKTVKDATEKSFEEMLKDLRNLMNEEDIIIPIRPIIIGGDDITFICRGDLGIFLAEKFIKHFTKESVSDRKQLSACAGVCIVKTKYPFYRAYELAEQLCSNAKKKLGEKKDESYLDFFISKGGYSGALDQIRETHYNEKEGNLNFGPYRIDKGGEKDSLSHLKEGIKYFRKNWPKSKVMELRDVLMRSEDERKMFLKSIEVRGLNLYKINGFKYDTEIWQDSETPYYNIIEAMDFYPEKCMEGNKK